MLSASASSTPAATVPEGDPPKGTPKVETKKALADFFEAIDTQQTTIFNPQGGRYALLLLLISRALPGHQPGTWPIPTCNI
jgi:hypothetical protein